jgi:hypothetical protein
MDPGAVLTEQQRQLRFRKFIERKKEKKNGLETGSKKVKRPESGHCSEKSKGSSCNSFPLLPKTQQNQHDQLQVEDLQQLQMVHKSTASLQAKIATIIENYESTFPHTGDIFLQKLDSISEGDFSLDLKRGEFFAYIERISANFKRFALLQK